jgi:hypothetical protein
MQQQHQAAGLTGVQEEQVCWGDCRACGFGDSLQDARRVLRTAMLLWPDFVQEEFLASICRCQQLVPWRLQVLVC